MPSGKRRIKSRKIPDFLRVDADSIRPRFFSLLFISECGKIILRHNRIIIYVSVHFTFVKNAGSAFAFTWMFERLCRSNWSYAFFGARLRLRTFFMYLLRELVGQPNDPVIKIKKKDV